MGTENYGLEGIEALYDERLEGTNGSVVRLVAQNGTEMLFENYQNYNDAIDGNDLTLTLDSNIQAIAEKYLQQAMEANYIQNGGPDPRRGGALRRQDGGPYGPVAQYGRLRHL